MTRFTYFFICAIAAFLYIALGMIGILLAWSVDMQMKIIDIVLSDGILLSIVSLTFLAIGICLIFHLVRKVKHSSYSIKNDSHHILIDETIILKYVQSYWKRLFPEREVNTQLEFKNNKIRIFADLPNVPTNDQTALSSKISEDLREIFDHILGYKDEFVLHINYKPK